ncbi:hypothetical protein DXV24_25015 [Escherichia albertii]|nr:hypothetical protein [Escherichia albertii]
MPGPLRTAHRGIFIADRLHGLSGLEGGLVTSGGLYRLTPGFGGFTPVSYKITAYSLRCC